MTNKTLTIRPADATDAVAVARLAALDSASPPTGHLVLGEVGHELWAAIDLDSGTIIADPFRPSGNVVEMLRARVELTGEGARAQRRLGMRPRMLRAA